MTHAVLDPVTICAPAIDGAGTKASSFRSRLTIYQIYCRCYNISEGIALTRANPQTRADWREGFLFVGNQLVLDLVNTRLVIKGGAVELIGDFPALLHWFRAASLMSLHAAGSLERRWAGSSRAKRTAAAVRQLRERIRQDVLRLEAGKAIRDATRNEVNRLLAQHPMRTALARGGGRPALQTYFAAQEPEDLLAPVAHAAALLFTETPVPRIRKCTHCVAHFYDNSKKGNRRWCSMRICGNRQKVATYAARHRRRGT